VPCRDFLDTILCRATPSRVLEQSPASFPQTFIALVRRNSKRILRHAETVSTLENNNGESRPRFDNLLARQPQAQQENL
jgi:hypothetical protein